MQCDVRGELADQDIALFAKMSIQNGKYIPRHRKQDLRVVMQGKQPTMQTDGSGSGNEFDDVFPGIRHGACVVDKPLSRNWSSGRKCSEEREKQTIMHGFDQGGMHASHHGENGLPSLSTNTNHGHTGLEYYGGALVKESLDVPRYSVSLRPIPQALRRVGKMPNTEAYPPHSHPLGRRGMQGGGSGVKLPYKEQNIENLSIEAGKMDDQTRLARFESMRKSLPGKRISRNKKLFVVHKDLQKQCDNVIQRHKFDARVATADLNRQQHFVRMKKDKLEKEKHKCEVQREKTHLTLDRICDGHEQRERKYVGKMAAQEKRHSTFDNELVKALSKLSMPRKMKRRLTAQHYGVHFDEDDD